MSDLRPVRRIAAVAAVALAALAGGCGEAPRTPPHHRAGDEPAVAPALTRAPAGHIVRVGAQAEAEEFGRAVSVVSDGREIRRIHGFTQPGGVAAGGKDVALIDVGADVVTLIDGRSLRVLGHVATGSGISHDVAGAGGRLWVTETGANAVTELDVSRQRPRVIATFPTVRQPNTAAVDRASGRVFVAGASAGVVQFFDPPHVRSLR